MARDRFADPARVNEETHFVQQSGTGDLGQVGDDDD